MIHGAELRAGNYFTFQDKIFVCTYVLDYDIMEEYPVPLTADVLTKCGFNKSYLSNSSEGVPNPLWYITINNTQFSLHSQMLSVNYLDSSDPEYKYPVLIDSLHTLQNHIFDKTGVMLHMEI